jgi:hypothetical protein
MYIVINRLILKMRQGNITTSNNRIAFFILLCITIVAVIIDTSIVKLYRFTDTPISVNKDIATFVVIVIVYAIAQYILLRTVKIRTEGNKRYTTNTTYKIVFLVQYMLIALNIFVILQMIIISAYNIVIVATSIAISYVLAVVTTGLLTLQFFSWFKSTKNKVVLAYTVTAAALSINAGFTLVYVVQGLLGVSAVVRPHIGHITAFAPYAIILNSGYVLSSIVSFLITWIATILLLRHHSKKIGAAKYWILVTIPLVYFMGQFEPSFLDLFSAYRMSNPILFNVLYTVIFGLSKPVGGILFGIAFWIVARSVRHTALRDYLMIAGYGFLLLFTSNQATVLINSPYPPFGMASISFVGLSSYLILVGVYSSAVSVAQDAELRRSIRNSIEQQLDLLDKIGTAEMENEIVKNILAVTKKQSLQSAEQTGVGSSLEEDDIREYLVQVVEETRRIRGQNKK